MFSIQARFRPAEVPILLSDTRKIEKIGFKVLCSVEDIIADQIAFFSDPATQGIVSGSFVSIIEPDNIVFLKVLADLYFDHFEWDLP